MPIVWDNFATTTITTSVVAVGATTFDVEVGDGGLFPSPTGDDYAILVLENQTGTREVVHLTSRTNDTFTVERGKETTSAVEFVVGDRCELRITKGFLEDFVDPGSFSNAGIKSVTRRSVTPTDVPSTLLEGELAVNVGDSPPSLFVGGAGGATVEQLVTGSGSGWALVETQTASTSSYLTFASLGSYKRLDFVFDDVLPTTDGGDLRCQIYDGSQWRTGTVYHFITNVTNSNNAGGTTLASHQSSEPADVGWGMAVDVGSDQSQGCSGVATTILTATGTPVSSMTWHLSYMDDASPSRVRLGTGSGRMSTSYDVTQIRFYYLSDTIASGKITLYGIA